MTTRLVVVGGGISGLAAAWAAGDAARRAGAALEVLVLERAERVGGKAHSIARDGWLVEGGPSGYLGGRPAMERLIAAAGLQDDTVPAAAAAARRYVYREGRMRRVVGNPVGLMREGLLSARGAARLVLEPFVKRRRDGADETVWAFAARRIGAEAADRLVRPMALGIFAGDAGRLSLGSAFPRMAALEREHGSLVRGLIAKRGKMSSGRLTSFRRGMQSLPLALAERGGFEVRCGVEVRGLRREGGWWRVAVSDGTPPICADGVVLAGEPWSTAALLRDIDPHAAAELDAIPCPPVSVVALGFGPAAAARVPEGFGVLITRDQSFRMLGNLWETQLYPERGPAGHVLIRAMFGGAVDPEAGALSEDEILCLARHEVARLYGITDEPTFSEVVRVPRAIPQYELGHRERVAAVESATACLPGLWVTGFGLRGVSFADAATDGVGSGEAAAASVIAAAQHADPASRRQCGPAEACS